MTGAAHLQTISPDESAATALHRLATTAAEQLAVVQDGRFLGFIDGMGIGLFMQTGQTPRRPAPGSRRHCPLPLSAQGSLTTTTAMSSSAPPPA